MVSRQPLVGRGPALAMVAGAVAAALGRRPGLVLVAGEPGVGKTALLAEAARQAGDSGARVLWGQCWEGEGTPAYWPWIQVLRSVGPGELSAERAALVRLLDPSGSTGRPVDDGPTSRFDLFDAVTRLLSDLADQTPVVVVLDDLQWADDASLTLLEFAARHLRGAAVLLLGAYRDTETPPRLRHLSGLAETLPLAGLDLDAVAAAMGHVTGAEPAPALAAQVHERTGGNPLFVRELTRLLLAQGGLPEAGRPLPVVLDSVRETLQRRLARLSHACGEMLSVAAVAGPEIHVEVLRRVLDAPADLAEVLAEAVTARVLMAAPAPSTGYRFSHDLFRETTYAWLAPAERNRLHLACGRVADALARSGAPVPAAEVARHFVVAGAGDPDLVALAVTWSRRAAHEAIERLAPEDARQHYQRALDALDTIAASGADRVGLLLGLADAHDRAGEAEAAATTYQRAARLARDRADPEALADAAIGLHSLGAPSGLSHAASIALLREAVAALSTTSPRRPLVLASLARDLYHSWEHDQLAHATALAEQAVALAREQADPIVLARCLLAVHDTRWLPGSAPARLAVVDEILALATDTADPGLRTQALLLRATARLELGDPRGHHDLTEHCLGAEASGHARGRWQALSRRATSALIAGDIAEAHALSEQAARLGERIGEPDWSSVADSQLWEILRFTGERSRYAEQSHNRDTIAAWPPWPALGRADDGDPAGAAELLVAFDVDRGFRPGPRTAPEPWTMAIVAEAVAAAGTRAQCEELYRRLTPLAGLHVIAGGCAAYGGAFDHYLGLLATTLGDPTKARGHFAAAVAMYERLGASAWLLLSRRHLDRLAPDATADPDPTRPVLRPDGGTWRLAYAGREVHLPDRKGLRDLAELIARPGTPVHVTQLLTGAPPARFGADPVLDHQAKTAYRRRLEQLDEEIDDADRCHDRHRAERGRLEREALLRELTAAAGLGGRDRRLGDSAESARKTVTSRIRDTISRVREHHPELAGHLDATVTTGTWCCYTPAPPAP